MSDVNDKSGTQQDPVIPPVTPSDADAAKAAAGAQDAEKKVVMVSHAALHEERIKRQEADVRIKELEAKEKTRLDEKLAADGKFQELSEAKTAENEALRAENESYKQQVTAYEGAVEVRVDIALEKIKDKADKELVKNILDGKSAADQDKLLPSLLIRFAKPTNINKSVNDDGQDPKDAEPKTAEDKRKAAYEQAVKDGNGVNMIKYAPTIERK